MKVILNEREKGNLQKSLAIIAIIASFVFGCFVGNHGANYKLRKQRQMYAARITELQSENSELKDTAYLDLKETYYRRLTNLER